MFRNWIVISLGALLLGACGSALYSSSEVKVAAPPYQGPVTVRVGAVPEGAKEIGTIEAHNVRWRAFPQLLDELREEAARIGADFVKIDEIRMEWSTQTTTTHSADISSHYAGGSPPKSGAFQQGGEVGTHDYTTVGTAFVGRAFRSAQP